MRLVRNLSTLLFLALALLGVSTARADDDDPGEVHLAGAITALPGGGLVGDWTVGGKTVHVTASTEVEGTPAVGATANVEGTLNQDGSIDAKEIDVRAAGGDDGDDDEGGDIHGIVSALPQGGLVGDWTVSGKTIHVTSSTQIDQSHGNIAVGAVVVVHGTLETDGSIDAQRIKVVGSPSAPPGKPALAELRGTVEVLASGSGFVGDWTVSGKTVHVTAATRLDQEDGALDVGSLVEVKGTLRNDGSIDARKVEVLAGSGGATSTMGNTFFVVAARAQGKNGTFYTTDLTISNTGQADAKIDVLFTGHGRDGRTKVSTTFTVAAGATKSIKDVLGTLFGLTSEFGALRITSNVTTIVIEATTSTPGGGGTFGQGQAALSLSDLATSTSPRSIAGVRSDAQFRTNLALVNATEGPLDVDLALVAGDGGRLGATRLHLQPLEMLQLDDAPRALGAQGGVAGARLLVSTPTAGGAFAALANVIDNSTNDPRSLAAR